MLISAKYIYLMATVSVIAIIMSALSYKRRVHHWMFGLIIIFVSIIAHLLGMISTDSRDREVFFLLFIFSIIPGIFTFFIDFKDFKRVIKRN